MKTFWQFIGFVVVISLMSCNMPQEVSETQAPPSALPATAVPQQPSPTKIVPTTIAPPPEHHIAIRGVNGIGEFYNRETGQKFVPRGMNYIRLGQQTKMDGSSTVGHSLFDPGKYNSLRVSGDLTKMYNDGYNVVRVFLSPDTMGSTGGGFFF